MRFTEDETYWPAFEPSCEFTFDFVCSLKVNQNGNVQTGTVSASAPCGRGFFFAFWPKGRRSPGDLLLFGLDCLASVEIVNSALRVGFLGKLAEELGEVSAATLKLTGRSRGADAPLADREANLCEEMADLFGFLLMFAAHRGIDLGAAFEDKWGRHLQE